MAYGNKLEAFPIGNNSNPSKVSLSNMAQKSVASRAEYSSRQSVSKDNDFSAQLDKASVRENAKEDYAKVDDGYKEKTASTQENIVESNKNDDAAKKAVSEGETVEQNQDPLEDPLEEALDKPDVKVSSNTVSLLQFMSSSGSVEALLANNTASISNGNVLSQPLAENAVKALGAVEQLSSAAKELGNAVQAMVEQADDVMDLPDGLKEVVSESIQPSSLDSLLSSTGKGVTTAQNSQQLLNMLYGKFVPQQQAVEQPANAVQTDLTAQLEGSVAQAATISVSGDVDIEQNPLLQSVNGEGGDEAADAFAGIMKDVVVSVENKGNQTSQQGQGNPQDGRRDMHQNEQELQRMFATNPENQAQLVKNTVGNSSELAPADNIRQDSGVPSNNNGNNVAGANFQQQLNTANSVDESPVVQQPQKAYQDYDVPKQIVEQARLIKSGQDTEMVIKLNPRHLGDLTLKVAVNGNGGVTATFHSDSSTVRGILETSLIQLKQELADQGIRVDKISISAGLQQDLQNMGQGFYDHQQGQRNMSSQGDLRSYEDGDGEAYGAVGAVDGVPVNASSEPIRDSQGNIVSDGVDYRV